MRKRFLIILTSMVMAMTLTACGRAGDGKQKTDNASAQSEQEKDGIPGDVQEKSGDAAAPEPDGDVTPISLEPGLSAAVCDYLFDSVGAQTESGEVVIPGFIAVKSDEKNPENIRVWGDFWYMTYDLQGDVLLSGEGREYSGCMHFRQEDGQYVFQSMDFISPDTGEFARKKLFGESFAAWMKLQADYRTREETRAQLIADYAGAFGLPAVSYQDYGWNPQKLPVPCPDEENVFCYVAHRGREAAAAARNAPEEEVPQEEAYVVKRGDTLGKSAGKYGVSIETLAERNRDTIIRSARSRGIQSEDLMRCADYIFPEEILAIPAGD